MASYESGYDAKYGYNKNAFAHGTVGTKLMGGVVKGITLPIGLVSEAIHDYKDRKKPSQQMGNSQATQTEPSVGAQDHATEEVQAETEGVDVNEADWALDELTYPSGDADDTDPPPVYSAPASPTRAQAQEVHQQSSVTSTSPLPPPGRLPFPVLVPQRRPGTKTRGFVRAYAPALSLADISQPLFLSFIDDLHRAAQSSPILQAIQVGIQLSGITAIAYPPSAVAVNIATTAAMVAVGMAQEVQERWRTNKFLEKANRDIFAPRGLWAMIVTYKSSTSSETEVGTTTVDLAAQAVARYGSPAIREREGEGETEVAWSKRKRELMQRFRLGDGKTNEAEMPFECAPLIFPAIEDVAMKTTRDGKNESLVGLVNKSKEASLWLGDYFDRRAQAHFAFHNPDAKLAAISQQSAPFKSRFADPNHAVNTHMFTLLTGGLYKAEPLGAKRRWEAAKRKEAEARRAGQKTRSAKRFLAEDVLYLHIVNMPAADELEAARRVLREKGVLPT